MIDPTLAPYVVLAVVAVAFVLFVTERMRADGIAMGAAGALVLLGLLTPNQLLAVFSNEAPITVGAMFVLSAALDRTGVIEALGGTVTRLAGRSQALAMLAVTIGSASISAFMNNTPVVVIMTPVVIAMAYGLRTSPSKFLIPLSYATVLGGTCSMIGTSTNIVVSGAVTSYGLEPFHMFEITPLGVVLTLAGIVYLALFAPRLLPVRESFSDLNESSRRRQFLTEVLIPLGSPLLGKSLSDAGFVRKLGTRVIDVIRNRVSLADRLDAVVLEPGDRVVLRTNAGDVVSLRDQSDVAFESEGQHAIEPIGSQDTVLMEAIVGPQSRFVGHRLADLNLRRLYGVYILAVHRQNENLRGNFDKLRLAFGDTILLEGPPHGLRELFQRGAFVSLSQVTEQPLRRNKAPIALGALAAVIVLASLEIMPISALSLIASLVVVGAGCLDADEAYGAVRWPLLMLIFGSLALGKAMETSGAAQVVVDATMGLVSDLGPVIVLSMLYLVTMILTEFLSNNATAILLTPIAIGLAQSMGVDPRPFVVAVMFAASTAFATPIGYQTNTFVYGAGGYKFADFIKVGVPLNVIVWVLASLLIPVIWPLTPAVQP
jgi:di/tricarboxylate transporter